MLLDILHAEGHDAAVGVKRALGAALYGLGDKELLDKVSVAIVIYHKLGFSLLDLIPA